METEQINQLIEENKKLKRKLAYVKEWLHNQECECDSYHGYTCEICHIDNYLFGDDVQYFCRKCHKELKTEQELLYGLHEECV